MARLIEPRTLRGFRDYPPRLMIPRERVLETARHVYRSFGYAPIDTPALEYAEILLGRGGEESDRQVYRFRDQGDRDVALRFDLTVPFARYAAQHVAQPDCGVPFKRYAMGPVWRGENPTAGRFREFWQCDFDTIGTTAVAADAEVVQVVAALFAALEVPGYTIRLNNRLVLNGLLEEVGLLEQSRAVLIALDKLDKVGPEAVAAEMARCAGAAPEQVARVLAVAAITGSNAEVLDQVAGQFGANAQVAAGVARLREVLALAEAAGVPGEKVKLDLSIARGLDYYTGTIYETVLTDLPAIGSVCSGGRYDNLAGQYTKQVLPGVGASLGVDRLLAALEQVGHPWLTGAQTPAAVLVIHFEGFAAEYTRMAQQLRRAGVAAELYPEAKKPKAQFEYADRRGFRFALIAGSAEFAAGAWKLKDLAARTEVTLPAGDVVAAVAAAVNGGPA